MPATRRQPFAGPATGRLTVPTRPPGEQTSVSVRNATGVRSNAYAARLGWQVKPSQPVLSIRLNGHFAFTSRPADQAEPEPDHRPTHVSRPTRTDVLGCASAWPVSSVLRSLMSAPGAGSGCLSGVAQTRANALGASPVPSPDG